MQVDVSFLDELTGRGLLLESGVPGLYGRSGTFDDVVEGCAALVTRAAEPDSYERLRFPPLLPRRDLERAGYLRSFPHLAGAVFAFAGGDAEAAVQLERAERGDDWSEFQEMTDLVLAPAACYPVYPAIATRGPLPPRGVAVDVGAGWVFRREPSSDPARLQAFRLRECVRLGEPEGVRSWLGVWRERAVTLLARLGLETQAGFASDPFFGRGGKLLSAAQVEQELKLELSVPIAGAEPTAVVSLNYHETHFASAYDIRLPGGELAHTACIGFGLERVALALLRAHGGDPQCWPAEVRAELWPA